MFALSIPCLGHGTFLMQKFAAAAEKGDVNIFKEADLETVKKWATEVDEDGRTAVHRTASRGFLDLLQYLLADCPHDVNASDESGWTALHSAAAIGRSDITALLLKYSADMNLPTSNGGRPLHYAASKGRKDVVIVLLDKGAQIDLVDVSGVSRSNAPITAYAVNASGVGRSF
eukprot:Lankesteria_metandrocarpae@DN4405_c0_g1_i2.p1